MESEVNKLVQTWESLHKEGRFSARSIREHWRLKVPEIYSPQPNCNCLRISCDEDLAQKLIFEPLERFMCAGDPAQVYQMVRQLDNPPSLCGRVFKNGDPTYGCRDCGMDPTCVLCADCFKNSAHSKHRYKISTSSGGGYCDCGDREAWKSDVYCDIHIKGEMALQNSNPLEKLPQDLVERIHLVFDCALNYSRSLLHYEEGFSLPSDLEIRDADKEPTNPSSLFDTKDTYVTMLYNDEMHTYDQVIYTLEKAIRCTQKDAVSYATSIDREGRCIVRCSSFQQCTQTKSVMEKQTSSNGGKALKVQVIHTHVIGHQIFASRLLSWLQDILEMAQAFRLIFSDIVNNPVVGQDGESIVVNIVRNDTLMWKAARVQWHRLFIYGLLMDQESKKLFARMFTKHYAKMMKDFIQDDHDHAVSVASLGVQLFTMPTVAHMLVAEEDILAKLLNTFLSECERKLKDSKLALEHRSSNTSSFRRIQYVLYDLKYLLGVKPEVWTDELRKGFLHGYSHILTLLKMMQGMDPMIRQVGQHMEFEPEWESAFNLHIKLAAVIPLVIEWAASDRVVLIKAFRMLLKNIGELCTEDMRRRYVRELLDYSVSCIEYDVSSAPVSIHLPLSRLVAGLVLHLDKFGLNYNSSEFHLKGKPTPEELMEPVLRTQIMIAQVHAGMWRRNGFSLINQIYFYHNVRCRQEMLDRDVMLLQAIATLMDANEFLVHVLNRFNLMSWCRDNYEMNYFKSNDVEDNMSQTVTLAEEFLQLVMTVIGERHTPGIGKVADEDRIKKEIVQLLSIEPMPHSVLNKALPEGTNHETGMEKVVSEVAIFKKPQGSSKGVFELRQEYYGHYNLFYYHYTREEQSKSEVAQRGRKKTADGEECCPPPVPPPFVDQFTMVVNILQCDVFLHIIRTILQRMSLPKSQSVSESQLQKVLHLIGYALHEEERFFANHDPYFQFTARAEANHRLLLLLENLSGTPRAVTHQELLVWTIKKYRTVLQLYCSSSPETPESATSSDSCSASIEREGNISDDRQRKADLAAQRKARIMAKMALMQNVFIRTNETLFMETSCDPSLDMSLEPTLELDPMELSELPEDMVAVGPLQTLKQQQEPSYTCILCHQEDAVIRADGSPGRAMVLGALVQRSTVLSRNRDRPSPNPDTLDPLTVPADLHWGVHTSSCGHAMHAHCWQKFFEDVLAKERRRPYRFRQNLSFDIEKSEFLCPLCEGLCNTALPVLPSVTSAAAGFQRMLPEPCLSLSDWAKGIYVALRLKSVSSTHPDPDGTEGDTETSGGPSPSSGGSSSIGQLVVAHVLRSSLSTLVSHTSDGGAVRGRAPRWRRRLPIYKRARRPAGGGGGSDKDSDEDGNGSGEDASWTPSFLETVLNELNESDSLSEIADEFKRLFTNPAATTLPVLPSHIKETMGNFAHSVYMHGLGVNPNVNSPRIAMLVWASTSYTIRTLEETQRNADRALLSSLSTRQKDCFSALVRFAAFVPHCAKKTQSVKSTCLRLLSTLFEGGSQVPCVLQWDAFSVLVTLSLSLPSLFPKIQGLAIGSTLDLFLLRVTLLAHLVQLLFTYEIPQEEMDVDEEPRGTPVDPDASWLVSLLAQCRAVAQLPPANVQADSLLRYIKLSSLPFLRCCGIFFHFLTGVPVPEELQSSVWVPESEFYCLLRYLGLPHNHIRAAFEEPVLMELLGRWCSDPRVTSMLDPASGGSNDSQVVRSWTCINQLVPLPRDYSELINTVSQFPCPASSGDDSRTPTMCLVCGKMLCSQSYCCQTEFPEGSRQMAGACTYHAHFCGMGTGVFLRVRECKVLLLSGRIKGCFVAPPYLDEYGETDQGLKRGNPLYLDPVQYARLQSMWLSHSIPDTIAHTMESNSNLMGTQDWQHL